MRAALFSRLSSPPSHAEESGYTISRHSSNAVTRNRGHWEMKLCANKD